MSALTYRPLAERMEDGRFAVYVGANYQYMPREAALALLDQLGRALQIPAWPRRFRFAAWASRRHRLPSRDEVMAHFPVNRATAYRWIAQERREREEAACCSNR